jgi:hypothetical protein
MRIYIAHPYTGNEEKNRERALKAEELLREVTPNAEFFNPVGRLSLSEQFKALRYVEVMNRCLAELASCDGIVLCGKWEDSPGCRMEAKTARELQLPCWYGVDAYLKNWKQVEIEARRKEKMAI